MKLKYLGHSAFELSTPSAKILVDPFLVKCSDYDYSNTTEYEDDSWDFGDTIVI